MITLLIDSNYLGYQAAFTHKGLKDSKGRNTGVIFGFLSRLLYLGLMFKTNNIVFCWDSRKSRRKLILPTYKQRLKDLSPEELEERMIAAEQFYQLSTEILPFIGFKNIYQQTGFESDDLLAKMIESWIGEYVIITGDEDLYQLLYACRIYHPSKNKMMTLRKLQDEYGVTPAQWVQVKQIAGCTSDKVPGVPNVGEKTAIKYIKKELKETSKAYEAIKKCPNLISFNEQLVKLPFEGTKIKPTVSDCFSLSNFKKLCKEYNFDSFLEDISFKNWELLFSGAFEEPKVQVEIKNKIKIGQSDTCKSFYPDTTTSFKDKNNRSLTPISRLPGLDDDDTPMFSNILKDTYVHYPLKRRGLKRKGEK